MGGSASAASGRSWKTSKKARRSYTRGEIVAWLRVFLSRFFGTTQFKRTCIPNGPKVGSGGGALSTR